MLIPTPVFGNIIKSLGPNDRLVQAVAELSVLLTSETSIVVAQVNNRTSDMQITLDRTERISSRTYDVVVGSHATIARLETGISTLLSSKGEGKDPSHNLY